MKRPSKFLPRPAVFLTGPKIFSLRSLPARTAPDLATGPALRAASLTSSAELLVSDVRSLLPAVDQVVVKRPVAMAMAVVTDLLP